MVFLYAGKQQIDNLSKEIGHARESYGAFIRSCMIGNGQFRLTPRSEATPFALCFAIFGFHLLKQTDELDYETEFIAKKLKDNLFKYKTQRESADDIRYDKPFLQLLTFTLSSLYLLGRLQANPLEEIISPLLSRNIEADLRKTGALDGIPQSGNFAMFMAILLIHTKEYLGIDTKARIDEWTGLHLNAMNERGFWGSNPEMTYLEFQNGYHQYEIFEYLNIDNSKAGRAAECVESLADREGHFGPYPGGGGCYDYDAVSILTGRSIIFYPERHNFLKRTLSSILKEQNPDGGFGETHCIRPRSLKNLKKTIRNIVSPKRPANKERLRYALTLQRPKHNRIETHWSRYSREWGESDLWDSWFRMLTIARVCCENDIRHRNMWGFINYPGIGYYHGI